MKRLFLICGLALSMASASLAAHSTPTLLANPNPIVVGGTVQWSGCGYRAGELLWLQVYASDGSTLPGGNEYERADGSGCFSSGAWTVDATIWSTGTVTVSIFDASSTGGKPKANPLASQVVNVA